MFVSNDTIELTDWQKNKLHELNDNTIGELIEVDERKLKEARYIADARARQIKNAAVAQFVNTFLDDATNELPDANIFVGKRATSRWCSTGAGDS